MTAGPGNVLEEDIYPGELDHAAKHNAVNDQVNWLTEQVVGLDVSDQIEDAINALVAGAPGALDTLREIADQLATDETAAAAITTLLNAIRNVTDSTFAAKIAAANALGPTYSSLVYDTNDNLTSWVQNGINCSATYDTDGNCLTLTIGTTTRTFTYDANGNLTGAS